MAKMDLVNGPKKQTPNKMMELADAIGYPVVRTATKDFLDCDANVPGVSARVLENIIEMKDTSLEKATKSTTWLAARGAPDKKAWAEKRIVSLNAEAEKWAGQRERLVAIVTELDDMATDMSAWAEAMMGG